MKRPQIIGLTGPKRVGKTTVANILAKHVGFSALAFGDLLRHEVSLAFQVDISLFTDDDKKDVPIEALAIARCSAREFNGLMFDRLFNRHGAAAFLEHMNAPRSPREIMIMWAEEYRKPLRGAGYFDSAVKHKVHLQHSHDQLRHVVHDVRFPTNAKAIRDMGGIIWQITKPGCKANSQDPTETDGSEYKPEVVIANAHGLDHLQAIVVAEWMRAETGLGWTDLANIGAVAIVRVYP